MIAYFMGLFSGLLMYTIIIQDVRASIGCIIGIIAAVAMYIEEIKENPHLRQQMRTKGNYVV